MFGGSGSGGTGTTTALPEAELEALIEQASRYFDLYCGVASEYFEPAYSPAWESNHVYIVGDIVRPTTGNSHVYRVTTAGTSGSTEPTWPTSSGATVVNGTATFTEYGADVVATSQTIYGQGSSYLKLPPYVPGSLNTTLTVPTNYTAPTFIEKDGYLIITDSNGLTPFGQWRYPPYTVGWWEGVAITVSAIWGYEETPADVKLAVIELVINLVRETDPQTLKLTNLEGQALREKMPPRVAEIARRYRPKVGAAFA